MLVNVNNSNFSPFIPLGDIVGRERERKFKHAHESIHKYLDRS